MKPAGPDRDVGPAPPPAQRLPEHLATKQGIQFSGSSWVYLGAQLTVLILVTDPLTAADEFLRIPCAPGDRAGEHTQTPDDSSDSLPSRPTRFGTRTSQELPQKTFRTTRNELALGAAEDGAAVLCSF